jgi:glycosyltransferase involved in cell wall biosynthesis
MAGPKFDLEWEFGVRLAGLSSFAEGYLVTSGWAAEGLYVGDYEIISTSYLSDSVLERVRARCRYAARCLAVLRAARREGRPIDFVITYDPLLTGAIGWVAAALFRAKLICEVNGEYNAAANFIHVRPRWLGLAKRWAAAALARFVLARAHGIRTLHPKQLANLGYAPRPAQVVRQFPEFVNTRAFSNLGDHPIVLLVGFPFYVKGVDVAVAAFRSIAPQFPEWRLVVMGYYPDRRDINSAIGDCRAITHHAPVHHRHMNAHIGRCGIVLQSSRTEAMGRVLVEAMAAEKPRVASDVGGIPTVVADGRDGILVPAGDVAALAAALARLMGDPALRRRMGAAGAARAAGEFAPERYFRNVEALVGAVASGASVSKP